jgi:hypothetical protein
MRSMLSGNLTVNLCVKIGLRSQRLSARRIPTTRSQRPRVATAESLSRSKAHGSSFQLRNSCKG